MTGHEPLIKPPFSLSKYSGTRAGEFIIREEDVENVTTIKLERILPPETPVVGKPAGAAARLMRPRKLLGFGLVGGSVMVGGLVLLFLLVHVFGVEQHLAYLIQAISSIETNFFLNRFFNWKERKGNLFLQWLKFHSTSAVTFPVNQGLFAVMTAWGVNYLLVTIMGAGVAAVINYITNEYFVFHNAHTQIQNRPPLTKSGLLAQQRWPKVGVVIPIRNSQRTICQCIESVLTQNYQGAIEIFLVGNPTDQDQTWSALGKLSKHPRIHCLQVSRPYGWTGRDANLKRYCGCKAAVESGNDIIAFLDSQVTAPSDWIRPAVLLMQEQGVDGVAGRSQRASDDRSFSSLYQDSSLISEWPSYGKGFLLDQASFATAKGLPITNNLFIQRHIWKDIRRSWPMQANYSWEDFRLVNVILNAGRTIFCTNTLYVERHHKRKFRLAKQFSAGAGAVAFYQDYPENSYIRRRMQKARFLATALCLLPLVTIVLLALGEIPLLFDIGAAVCLGALFLSLLSMLRARSLRGFLFPLLDFLHLSLWLAGAAYVAGKQEYERDDEFESSLLALR